MTPLFLDTNILNTNNNLKGVFGNKSILLKLQDHYQLMIAQVVMDELVEHARKLFEKQKEDYLSNCFSSGEGEHRKIVRECQFEDVVDQIIEAEKVKYELVKFENPAGFIDKFLPLAVAHKPPFEERTDKGFKDALIAHTVECYAAKYGEVCLLTGDARLREYFANSDRVRVYKKVEDLSELNNNGGAGCSAEREEQKEMDKQIRKSRSEGRGGIETDVAEEGLVDQLCSSSSFAKTHMVLRRILSEGRVLSDSQEFKILKAAVSNNQITWLLEDDDVAQFMKPIFEKKGDMLTDYEYATFVDAAGLPNNRPTEFGTYKLSKCEKNAYRNFVDALINNLESRDIFSVINFDGEDIMQEMGELLAGSSIDEKLLSWERVAGLFIKGMYETTGKDVDRSVLEDFYSMLSKCADRKREEVLIRVAQRIDESDIELT